MTSDDLISMRLQIINMLEEYGMQSVNVDVSITTDQFWNANALSSSFKVEMEINGIIDSLTVLD